MQQNRFPAVRQGRHCAAPSLHRTPAYSRAASHGAHRCPSRSRDPNHFARCSGIRLPVHRRSGGRSGSPQRKKAPTQSSSGLAPMAPSPLVMLSPTNSSRYCGSGRGRNSPPAYSSPVICNRCAGSSCMACTSFSSRRCFACPVSCPGKDRSGFCRGSRQTVPPMRRSAPR